MSKKFVNNAELVLQATNPGPLKSSKTLKGVSFQEEERDSRATSKVTTRAPSLNRIDSGFTQSKSDFSPADGLNYPLVSFYSSTDTYDTYPNHAVQEYVDPYLGYQIDDQGRLLIDMSTYVDPAYLPEDISKFVCCWQKPQISSQSDWGWTSPFVWPDVPNLVKLIRMDIYEKDVPKLQIGTIDHEDSLEIRNTSEWYPVRSLFFMNVSTQYTMQVLLETMGPPRRSKYRPHNKQNVRDMSKWNLVTKVHAFNTPMGIPGSSSFFIDYQDFPDRYFITNKESPNLGNRRLYQFAAYSATQFYILEKNIHHETLDAEGGSGYTYYIESGPIVYAKKGWRIIGSFYGFDHQLPGSSQFTVYRRLDPFPRMVMALQNIERSHEWNQDLKFYAFDIPVPGTARYSLQHCLRSIYSNKASVSRHRLTTEDARLPWEFRMNLYMFPAELSDCTIYPYDISKDASMNYGVYN